MESHSIRILKTVGEMVATLPAHGEEERDCVEWRMEVLLVVVFDAEKLKY